MVRLLIISGFFVDSDLVFLEQFLFGESGQVRALLVIDVVINFNQLTQAFLLLRQPLFLSKLQKEYIMRLLYLLKLGIERRQFLIYFYLLVI